MSTGAWRAWRSVAVLGGAWRSVARSKATLLEREAYVDQMQTLHSEGGGLCVCRVREKTVGCWRKAERSPRWRPGCWRTAEVAALESRLLEDGRGRRARVPAAGGWQRSPR